MYPATYKRLRASALAIAASTTFVAEIPVASKTRTRRQLLRQPCGGRLDLDPGSSRFP